MYSRISRSPGLPFRGSTSPTDSVQPLEAYVQRRTALARADVGSA